MAATPPGAQKRRIDYMIDRKIYDDFIRMCVTKGYAPQIVVERIMKKYTETGQI